MNDSEELFRDGYIPRFDLSVTDSAWHWLQENATLEKKIPATLRIDGRDVGVVGLRYKGSQGTLYSCFDQGIRRSDCPRLSFKIHFNGYDKTKSWRGVKKINLHSMQHDPSLLRERIGYELFRANGVRAPQAGHAMVSINGAPAGLYGMVEQLDKNFIIRTSPDAPKGKLYKELWIPTLRQENYLQNLKNEKKIAASQPLFQFSNSLSQVLQTGNRDEFSRWTDPSAALRYLVVDLAINNIDGYRTFLCSHQPEDANSCSPHNFFWLNVARRGYFELIPWDLDRAFQLRPWYPGTPEWNDLSVDCSQPITSNPHQTIWPTVCDPYFRVLATHYSREYRNAIRSFLEGPFAKDRVKKVMMQWIAELEPLVKEDTLYTLEEWKRSVQLLQRNLRLGRWQMEQRLVGLSPVVKGWMAEKRMDFEDLTKDQASLMIAQQTFDHGAGRWKVEEKNALRGDKSLKLQGNGRWKMEWQERQMVDLNKKEAFRMVVYASQKATLHLKLSVDFPLKENSLALRDSVSSEHWGWSIPLDSVEREVTLSLKTLQRFLPAGENRQVPIRTTHPPQSCRGIELELHWSADVADPNNATLLIDNLEWL